MIKSMTGYGSAKGTSGGIDISIDVKSVNNRYLDCNIKMPRVYAAMEEALKSTVSSNLSRGKVDVFVTIDTSKADTVSVRINKPVADAYVAALRELSTQYGLTDTVTASELTRFPEVLSMEKDETDIDALAGDVKAVLQQALDGLGGMRAREGQNLAADIKGRLSEIERLTGIVEEYSPKSVVEYRARLEAKMAEVLENKDIDESRILMEAAIFADRVSVTEETVRLKSHVKQLRQMLESSQPVGRKLDFLIQELNREANTIGSKANDADLARIVVDLKAEIEKIREQAQNIE